MNAGTGVGIKCFKLIFEILWFGDYGFPCSVSLGRLCPTIFNKNKEFEHSFFLNPTLILYNIKL